MAVEKYLLEDGSGGYLKEDGIGVLLLESSDFVGDVTLNDYLFFKVGTGMSTSEKVVKP